MECDRLEPAEATIQRLITGLEARVEHRRHYRADSHEHHLRLQRERGLVLHDIGRTYWPTRAICPDAHAGLALAAAETILHAGSQIICRSPLQPPASGGS